MPKYVIERQIPGVGKLSAQELQAISPGGFPANAIARVRTMIEPTTAEA